MEAGAGSGPLPRAEGEPHPLDAGSILAKPVRLFPSLFAHRRPTVFIDYPPFVGEWPRGLVRMIAAWSIVVLFDALWCVGIRPPAVLVPGAW